MEDASVSGDLRSYQKSRFHSVTERGGRAKYMETAQQRHIGLTGMKDSV